MEDLEGVTIHSRAAWNAGEPSDKLIPHQIERITLHHSGIVFTGDKTSPQYLQNLQAWSLAERGWVDVPYHFLIDLQGEIWEGRPILFRGDTNTEYDPTGHALISVIGNYEKQIISPAQLTSIAKLMAALCKKYQVQPETIKSHKDYVPSTLCPGKDLYRYLQDGTLIDSVKKYLD